MAKFSLLDAFGLDASGALQQGAKLQTILPQFTHLANLPINEIALANGKVDLTFEQPIPVAVAGLSLAITAGATGLIRILRSDAHLIDREDPFGTVPIHSNEIFVQLGLEFSGGSEVSLAANGLAFGFSAVQTITLSTYRRFFANDARVFPSFSQALTQTFSSILLPQTRADLELLDRDTIIVLNGTGDLKLSASFGIHAPVQQLATSSPIAGKVVEVNASAGFTAGFGLKLEGSYQVRLMQTPQQALEIGLYKAKTQILDVTVSAGADLTAKVGKFDLAEKFVGALSLRPAVDREEFLQALPGEDEVTRDLKIATFQKNLAAAIATNISIKLKAGISNLKSSESALTFEMDLPLSHAGEAVPAIDAALRGDFSGFTGEGAPPRGVRQTSNIFTGTELQKHSLNLNLLGILNFVAVSKLVRLSTVARNANGDITLLTDTADANQLSAVLMNAAGDANRLRALLSEDFLLQSSFKTESLQVLPPEFTAHHTFFRIDEKTGRAEMKNLLDTCRVLNILTEAEEQQRLGSVDSFGRTTYWLQTKYSSELLNQTLFTGNGTPKSPEDFETAGRAALRQLLSGDEGQEFRKLIADPGPQGTAIWKAMKADGNPANFNTLFNVSLGQQDPRVAAAASDFICIRDWGTAINQLAQAILEVRQMLKGVVLGDNQRLTAARARLRDRMADVVKHSGEHFGDPLGLTMVFLASNSSAGVATIINVPGTPPFRREIPPARLSVEAIA